MKDRVQLKITMKTKNMYDFLIRHAYSGRTGIFSVLFTVIALSYLIMNYGELTSAKTTLLVLASLMFTVINPIIIYFNAAKQVKLNPMFRQEILYLLDTEKIIIKQEEQEAKVTWEEVQKVVETNSSIILYLNKVRAFIFPKEQLLEEENKLRQLINEKVATCKWKKVKK